MTRHAVREALLRKPPGFAVPPRFPSGEVVRQQIEVVLDEALNAQEWRLFDKGLWALARFPTETAPTPLLRALDERLSHVNLEDVVTVLGIIADPRSLKSLLAFEDWVKAEDAAGHLLHDGLLNACGYARAAIARAGEQAT